MESTTTEILHDFLHLMRVYKDGRIERLEGNDVVPASVDPITGVQSKDVEIAPEIGVGARLYLPANADQQHKLPVLVYFHGGGFMVQNPFSQTYATHLNALVSQANIVVVSVDYRLAPEHPLPVGYEDSWVAIKWVVSHFKGDGQEPWLKDHVDFQRVFFGGDSAGGNIAHNMAIRVGSEKLDGINILGLILNHPFFWGEEPIGNEDAETNYPDKAFVDRLWRFVNPLTVGSDDPMLNPAKNPDLPSLGCSKVLICVAEEDLLRDRGWYYYEVLDKSGWKGKVEIMETKGENHVFHLYNPTSESAVAMVKKVATFFNQHKD
ncbi:unnamed protein product [Ilex paraguariensis]|uniref:Alpha/beta hydrolase fold-3 domain-containing protein n=1 Tax=Ilex paraguariensis TaxID=185542 RepID=A0ABC8UJP0_9AQUA